MFEGKSCFILWWKLCYFYVLPRKGICLLTVDKEAIFLPTQDICISVDKVELSH